jgi:hypothetical protein
VVVVDFEANIGDELYVPDFVAVQIVEELDEDVEVQVVAVVGEGHKSDDERVLLPYFVHEDQLAVGLSELVVDQ